MSRFNLGERLGFLRERNEGIEKGLDEVRDEVEEAIREMESEVSSLQQDLSELNDLQDKLEGVDGLIETLQTTGEGHGDWEENSDAKNELRAVIREAKELQGRFGSDRDTFANIEDIVSDLTEKYSQIGGAIQTELQELEDIRRTYTSPE